MFVVSIFVDKIKLLKNSVFRVLVAKAFLFFKFDFIYLFFFFMKLNVCEYVGSLESHTYINK